MKHYWEHVEKVPEFLQNTYETTETKFNILQFLGLFRLHGLFRRINLVGQTNCNPNLLGQSQLQSQFLGPKLIAGPWAFQKNYFQGPKLTIIAKPNNCHQLSPTSQSAKQNHHQLTKLQNQITTTFIVIVTNKANHHRHLHPIANLNYISSIINYKINQTKGTKF